MALSEILNIILGGGLITSLLALATLKATIRKANAEAEKAKAEAETVRFDNAEHATRILMENIVEPLKKELNATRREMARLRKALDHANACKYNSSCPVLYELRDLPKSDGNGTDSGNFGTKAETGQCITGTEGYSGQAYTDVGGQPSNSG